MFSLNVCHRLSESSPSPSRSLQPFSALSVFALTVFVHCFGAATESCAAPADRSDRPNILFILADDLGWRDLSGEGSSFYESPHLDGLAESGMRFTQGYATCQVCSPSRASIMTGKFPARHGITDWIGAASGTKWKRNDRILPSEYQHQLNQEETTIAEAFKEAGYRTFFAGKWHLGDKGSFPEDHGFEVNAGGHHRGSPPGGYFSPYKNPKLSDGPAGESLPIRLADETVTFIEQVQEENKQPFFAFLSFYSVHGPIQTTQPLWSKYQQKAKQADDPESRFLIDRTLPVRQVQDCPIYGGMIESMDDAVGRVLTALKRLGIDENTIVVFTSDNGGVSSGDAYSTSNLPLRGGKGRQWEGGIREPFFIRVPGLTEAGAVSDVPVTGADFYPTLLDLAGVPLMPGQHADGQSLKPLLSGGDIAERPLYWHYPHYGNQGGEPSSILRQNEWKLIHYYEDGRDELYNLRKDPSEQTDVAAENRPRVQQMSKKLQDWLQSVGAQIPQANPNFDEAEKKQWHRQIKSMQLPRLERKHAEYLEENFQPGKDWWGSLVDPS
ncbi:Arylsulfatase precursor [Roseimaritima multifibrata]|uniref:Arylsulfatase n=2 Tax=Roseimaritima multifibrata TaxID=1930274 RepID=A0A517MAM3_9BACT|nr:Arylsulfatase precursor [Roseimaritima multifibrata]